MPELAWQKSTYSGDASNCLEAAPAPTKIHIRDSKTPTGPHLALPLTVWADFVAHVAHPAH